VEVIVPSDAALNIPAGSFSPPPSACDK